MALKKCNAYVSLVAFLAMLVHICYNDFAYLTFYYNPVLKTATAMPFMICTCIHAVLGMLIVFLQGDGTRLTYPKKNVRTVIQRVTAALIFPMLILHLKTFDLMKETAGQGKLVAWWGLALVEVLFFGTILSHAAVSFSKALITLGWLSSRERQKKIDIVLYVFSVILFVASIVSVVRGQFLMFLATGGAA
ncbi:MAG: hypothetical protein K5678_09950 [Acetatifactor sp.]|nr:hypothetical protein [Acetatifactor sp.]